MRVHGVQEGRRAEVAFPGAEEKSITEPKGSRPDPTPQNRPGSQGEDTPADLPWAPTVGTGPPTATHVCLASTGPTAFPTGPQVGTR